MRRGEAPVDDVAVQAVALARVAVAVAVSTTGSFVRGANGSTSSLFILLALVWVPWSSVVLFAAGGRGAHLARIGGCAGDVLVVAGALVLVPSWAAGLLLLLVAIVAFGSYTAGPAIGRALAMAAIAAVAGGQLIVDPADRLDAEVAVLFSVSVVAVALIVERAARMQSRAAARSDRLAGKADAILDRVADGVVVTDAAGGIVQWNAAAQRIVAGSDHELEGRPCTEVLALWQGERRLDCSAGCALLGCAGDGDDELGCEVWRVEEDTGRRQPLLANASGVVDGTGTVVEVVHSLRDVTRLKQAEEAKTLFLATASHELKTPLTVINGFAETLLHFDTEPENVREALDAIHRRGRELSRIVDRLLLSSRIEAGRVDVTLDAVEIGGVLRERAAALEAATGRTIRLSLADSLPLVAADPRALTTVVDHLLDNAIKYSPGGEVVSLLAVPADDSVRIDVVDAGVGMDREQAARCFDKFWQAESTDVRRFGGTGIGLYIVRSLVEAMGGQVEVHSERGGGSTFSVWLLDGAVLESSGAAASAAPGTGAPTSIQEFMRQLGIPSGGGE